MDILKNNMQDLSMWNRRYLATEMFEWEELTNASTGGDVSMAALLSVTF